MKTRDLGNTGLSISEMGLGTWQLQPEGAHWAMSEADARSIVARSLELGCNFFDTAPNYGLGKSEQVLGRALEGRRDSVVLSTKFGHHVDDRLDFAPEALSDSLGGSLERLKTDRVDLLLLHNPPRECLDGKHPIFEAAAQEVGRGTARHIGVSIDTAEEMAAALDNPAIEAIEVMFNAFHQDPKSQFARAQEQGVGLIIKVPLDSGWLSGRYNRGSHFSDIRRRWTPSVLARRSQYLEQLAFLTEDGTSLVHAALRFVLAHPAVSTVIPGAKSVAQVEQNFGAIEQPLSQALVDRVHALYDQEFAQDPLPW